MEIPKLAAERMMWALIESVKDFAEANPERISQKRRFPSALLELLEDIGFRCINIGEPLFRDHHRSFWQMGFSLVPVDRPEFQYGSFK
ncbi:MAG: acyl-CoA mutase large subunit family protein [Proteobacteria bacterium]|nr:acyl-CoA mutase large subunit family protein [Pseudomonadota bacterium]